MSDTPDKKSDEEAPEKTAPVLDQKKVVKVKNISDRLINTSKDSIKPGETGRATVAEFRTYGKWLKKA